MLKYIATLLLLSALSMLVRAAPVKPAAQIYTAEYVCDSPDAKPCDAYNYLSVSVGGFNAYEYNSGGASWVTAARPAAIPSQKRYPLSTTSPKSISGVPIDLSVEISLSYCCSDYTGPPADFTYSTYKSFIKGGAKLGWDKTSQLVTLEIK
eukprot:gene3325-13356_t